MKGIFLLLVLLVVLPGYLMAQLAPKKGITILIDFEDKPADLTLERVDNLINGEGYSEPGVPHSVRDYYQNQSRNAIDLTYDIFGYYRAPLTFAEYSTMDWTIVNDIVTDALDSIVVNHPDYDWDAVSTRSEPGLENALLSVNIVTTGWIPGAGGAHWSTDWTAPNGYELYGFSVQPLTSSWDPTFIYLFVMTHELGHAAWGFPDTYDYDGSSFGTGYYSLMSGNQLGGEIESIGAPFYLDAGWAEPVDITPNTSYTLEQDGTSIARYVNPDNPNEYFLIEACSQSTPGNAALGIERGLIIWHIDENVTTNNTLENMTFAEHYEYSIEQADGYFDLENHINQGDAGDVFVEGSTFTAVTTPNSNWWNGEDSGLDIHAITFLPDNKIRFCNGTCSDLGIDDYSDDPGFSLYPTINAGHFFITMTDEALNEELVLSAWTATGQQVPITFVQKEHNRLEVTLDENHSGFIFISVSSVNGHHYGVEKMVLKSA
jgi:M6 family metalloprotease-like protein